MVARKPYKITSGNYIGRLGENLPRLPREEITLEGWEKTLRGNLGRLHWEVGRKHCEVTSGDYIGRLEENLMVERKPCVVR